MYGTYSQNTTTANLATGAQIMNIEQRYLLQKYFSNEATYSITTIGSTSKVLTATPAIGDVSATLTVAWQYASATATCTFSDGEIRLVTFTNGSTAITWQGALTAASTTALAVGGVQTYRLPPDYSKLKTGTLTIGNLRWTPTEIFSREDWDNLNVFPYYADIPSKYFIWNNQFNFWPIPSTTGNIITFNYQRRIPDLSLADYSTGTVSVSVNGTTVTGSGTAWTPTVSNNNESRWIQFAQPTGDNLWYQIQNVASTTSLTLMTPYYGTTAVSGGLYTMGQMPVIMEDFQDMLVWRALTYYFSSVVDNPKKKDEFQQAYDTKLALLAEYAGSKTIQVNLRKQPFQQNPNLFVQNIT